jgi:hypothetical protein
MRRLVNDGQNDPDWEVEYLNGQYPRVLLNQHTGRLTCRDDFELDASSSSRLSLGGASSSIASLIRLDLIELGILLVDPNRPELRDDLRGVELLIFFLREEIWTCKVSGMNTDKAMQVVEWLLTL